MEWNAAEAAQYYKKQGAPADQMALTALLKEAQEACGGGIPPYLVKELAGYLGAKESLLLALIRRLPRLRLADTHLLEVCAGRNCGKSAELAKAAEKLASERITVRFVPCMRQCGKGPNIRFDGTIYNGADGELLKNLVK